MADNLLESYNPLYDVHLRQYFALPHMQKHLRNLGLLDGTPPPADNELHAGHLQMMDMMLRNRERVLAQLVDLQRKLDAAEKVELYRRIRSGVTNVDELDRSHLSRSLSRPARSAARSGRGTGEGGRRRQSLSPEAGETIKRVENDYRSDNAPFKNPKSIYNRLAANVYKYQYLHKLDDRTLHKYMSSLRKQLAKLERFREVSFGPHTMARHQPSHLQQSWFFRRRSLPSLDAAGANQNHHNHQPTQSQPQANAGRRSAKSGLSRKSRSGKSQSPHRFSAIDEPPNKVQRTSVSRTRGTQRLPPLPNKKPARPMAAVGQRTAPTGGGKAEHRLPPTAVIRPTRKVPQEPTQQRRIVPSASAKMPTAEGKKTPIGSRPASQKGSITPVAVQKRQSVAGSDGGGILPAIGGAMAGAAVAAGIAAAASMGTEEEERKEEEEEEEEAEAEEENNRESGAPSPSISLAASQTTTTDGGQPGGGDSEWENEQNAIASEGSVGGGEGGGGTETKPTPEPEVKEEEEGQHTARPSIHSLVQSPEEEEEEQQPPEEPEPPKMEEIEEQHRFVEEIGGGEENIGHEEEEEYPEEPTIQERTHFEQERNEEGPEATNYPDEIHSLHKGPESPEMAPNGAEHEEEGGNDEEAQTGRSKRDAPFMDEEDLNVQQEGEELDKNVEAAEHNKENEEAHEEIPLEEPYEGEEVPSVEIEGANLDAAESERIRQFSHPDVDKEMGPEESVRSLASSSMGSENVQQQAPKIQDEEEQEREGPKENYFVEESELRDDEAIYEAKVDEAEGIEESKDFGQMEEMAQQPEEEERRAEEKEEEEEFVENENIVKTPVQIEITPSPENRNWDEEEETREEEGKADQEEEDINGNIDEFGVEMPAGQEENIMAESPAEQQEAYEGSNEIVQEHHEYGAANDEEAKEGDPVEEVNAEMDSKNTYVEAQELESKTPNDEEEIHKEEEEENSEANKEEAALNDELSEHEEEGQPGQNIAEVIEYAGHPYSEEQEEERNPADELADGSFERVKRDTDLEHQQSAELVESEPVRVDEDDTGRKLSGADEQLRLETNEEEEKEATIFEAHHDEQDQHFGDQQQQLDEEKADEGKAEELVENAPLKGDEEGIGRTPSQNGMETGERSSPAMANEEHKPEEDGIVEEQNVEDPVQMPTEVEESQNYFGKPNWTPRADEEEAESEKVEEVKAVEHENDLANEYGIEKHQDGEEEEHSQFQAGHEGNLHEDQEGEQQGERAHDAVYGQLANEANSANERQIPSAAQSLENDQIMNERPATAEATPKRTDMLSQPSIEITPASEYGGSMEDNRDAISIASSHPISPVAKESNYNDGNVEGGEEHSGEEIHQEDQPLIDFGPPSPIAQDEFGKTDEAGPELIEKPSPENQQQHNGHKDEEAGEEENEHDMVDEQTSLLSGTEEYGLKKRFSHQEGEGNGNGNGHLPSGNGASSSSSDTEGADGEGSEGEGSVVIHQDGITNLNSIGGDGGGHHQFQSVKLEHDGFGSKEEA